MVIALNIKGKSMKSILLGALLSVIFLVIFCDHGGGTIYGTWVLQPEKSTDLVTWRYRHFHLNITKVDSMMAIVEDWKHKRYGDYVDSVVFQPDKGPVTLNEKSKVWPENWYMGVLTDPNAVRKISGEWITPLQSLKTVEQQVVMISQGKDTISTERFYHVEEGGKKLVVQENRSTRPSTIKLVFERHVNSFE